MRQLKARPVDCGCHQNMQSLNTGKAMILFHAHTCTCQVTVLGKESLKGSEFQQENMADEETSAQVMEARS